MSNHDVFLAQIEHDLKNCEPWERPGLVEQAWMWFDNQNLVPEEEVLVYRKLVELVGPAEEIKREPKPRFTNLLSPANYPNTGWLAKYLDYTMFCGSPLPFHFFVGLGILGCALRRDAWIPFGRNDTYGSLYIVLVAPPGVCYKSTAINIGVDLLRDTGLVPVIGGRATPEALSDMLSTAENENGKDAIAMIGAAELYRFLAGHNTPANNQIVSALTSWYDSQREDDDITISRKRRMLHNIAISLLGGTTLEWLVESLPKHVFAGGFMSRVVFVAQETTDRIMSISPPDDPAKRKALLEGIKDIKKNFKGPIELSSAAYKVYDMWFHQQHRRLATSEERVADFYQRRADHVRKVSLILAASNQHSRIEEQDVSCAIKVLDMLNPALDSIITPISLGESGQDLDIIRRTVERYDEITRTELVRKMSVRGIDAGKVNVLVDTLKQAGLVFETKIGRRGGRLYKWAKE